MSYTAHDIAALYLVPFEAIVAELKRRGYTVTPIRKPLQRAARLDDFEGAAPCERPAPINRFGEVVPRARNGGRRAQSAGGDQ